jgi:hypothetical protein
MQSLSKIIGLQVKILHIGKQDSWADSVEVDVIADSIVQMLRRRKPRPPPLLS